MPTGDLIRNAMKGGAKQLGAWVNMESPIATEIMAGAGFDFIMIDQEHGPGDALSAITQLQAIRSGGTGTAMMRVRDNDTQFIKKALDTGIDGIMVPLVETAEAASQVVAACRLPPLGVRGVAPGNVRAARYGYDKDAFIRNRGEDVLVLTQVETEETVGNLSDIGGIEGIDVLFIGRNDLSSSIDRLHDQTSPEARELLDEAERRIRESGRLLGGIPAPFDGPVAMFERGYDMVLAVADHALLRDAAVAAVSSFRPA